MIYVTHDQIEAMTLGNRIAVMKDGCIQQLADPVTVYDKPVNKFVGGFIGTPPMNFINGRIIKKGDKFYFDGSGNLITKLNPKRICVYALSTVAPLIFTANELFYAGADPNEMRFNRTGCFDVGVRCGGWGRVVMEVRLEDRK